MYTYVLAMYWLSYFPSFTDLAISGATMGISNFPVQILNLLKNKSRYKLDCPNRAHHICQFCATMGIQIFLSRFGISLKNEPRYKLNNPIQSRSPNSLLMPQSLFWV